jgi:hypothetical protein
VGEITNLVRDPDQNCRTQMICLSRLKVNVGSGCLNPHRSFAVGVHTTTRFQTPSRMRSRTTPTSQMGI